MLAVPKIPRLKEGSPINFRLVNHIIKRVEYAASIIEEGVGEYYIGFTGSTGQGTQQLFLDAVTINSSNISLQNQKTLGGTIIGYTPSGGGDFSQTATLNIQNRYYTSSGLWITNPFKLPIKASFRFTIRTGAGALGADGACFHISKKIPTSLGAYGGGLGVLNIGIPIISVELDTYINPFDPPFPHLAITKNGDVTNHLGSKFPLIQNISFPPFARDWSWPININFSGRSISASSIEYFGTPQGGIQQIPLTISANVSI